MLYITSIAFYKHLIRLCGIFFCFSLRMCNFSWICPKEKKSPNDKLSKSNPLKWEKNKTQTKCLDKIIAQFVFTWTDLVHFASFEHCTDEAKWMAGSFSNVSFTTNHMKIILNVIYCDDVLFNMSVWLWKLLFFCTDWCSSEQM